MSLNSYQLRASGRDFQARFTGQEAEVESLSHTHLHRMCTRAESLQSCPTLCDSTEWGRQAPVSMGFSRQEYWSGLPCPPPGDLHRILIAK